MPLAPPVGNVNPAVDVWPQASSVAASNPAVSGTVPADLSWVSQLRTGADYGYVERSGRGTYLTFNGTEGTAAGQSVRLLEASQQFQKKQGKGTVDVWWLFDDGGESGKRNVRYWEISPMAVYIEGGLYTVVYPVDL